MSSSLKLQVLLLLTVVHLVAAAAAAAAATVDYDLVEEGEINGRRFQRFRAAYNNEAESGRKDHHHHHHHHHHGSILSIRDWTESLAWVDTDSLNAVLREAPFQAYYFEIVPTSRDHVSSQPLEFVLVDAPGLAKRQPRFRSFEEPCSKAAEESPQPQHQSANLNHDYGCIFSNSSGDATLIVPKPLQGFNDATYTHLANFIRQGHQKQIDAMWQLVATAYREHYSSSASTVWLSTAGNGVPWLHFRLDNHPKYYRYKPFKLPLVHMISDGDSEL